MSGFGRYLKPYTKCPIKNKIMFDKVHADSKMLLLIPNIKSRIDVLWDVTGLNKQKDFINVSFTGAIIDV